MVRNETGLTTATVESIWSVHDTLFCEVSQNLLEVCPNCFLQHDASTFFV